MAKYVVTFFGKDSKRRRYKLFPEEYYYVMDGDGNITGYGRGMTPETIHKMLTWLDEQPLCGMLRNYGIKWALTDISSSSIIVDVSAETPEMEEEMLVTLKIFGGSDIRIREPEKFPMKMTDRERNVGRQVKDRYAR